MTRRRNIGRAREEIGKILDDRFRIEVVLGSGSTGDVFRASVLDDNHRQVALKILDAGLSHEKKQIDRFKREVAACSRLRHPHIVRTKEYGRFRDGRLYLAMEYLKGETLGARLRRDGPLSLAMACDVVRQVAEALVEAHAHGVIHRDLKPDNIFLAHQGGSQNFVKVLDFGIARFVGDNAVQETLTRTGFVAGTPLYLSPEQGRGKLVDPRSDLYTLGVVLYELIVGRPPFVGESPVALVMQHVQEPPPAPSSLNSELELPPLLIVLLERLLAKDREERPTDAAQVVAALETIENALADTPEPHVTRRMEANRQSQQLEAVAHLHALPQEGVQNRSNELHELTRVLHASLGNDDESGLPVVEVELPTPQTSAPRTPRSKIGFRTSRGGESRHSNEQPFTPVFVVEVEAGDVPRRHRREPRGTDETPLLDGRLKRSPGRWLWAALAGLAVVGLSVWLWTLLVSP